MSSTNDTKASREDIIPSHTQSWSAEKRAKYNDYIATQTIDHQPLLAAGDHAVVESGDKILMVALKPQSNVRVREKKAQLFPLVGRPFNATYLFQDNVLKRRLEGKVSVEKAFQEVESKTLGSEFMPTSNNKDLLALQENQKLSWEEIQQMKESDLDASEIMKRVTEASSTWEGKTEFSQMKWLQRKMSKYSRDIQIREPTPSELLKITSKTEKNMLHYVRDDTLAMILHITNIGHGMRTIVIDGTDGLMTGAVQRKQGDSGAVMHIHCDHRSNQALLDMNLPKDVRKRIISLAYDSLPSYGWAQHPQDWIAHQRQNISTYFAENPDYSTRFPNAQQIILPCMTQQAENFFQHKALALIILQQSYDPLSLLLPLLRFVLPSSPFVIYCQTLDRVTHVRTFLQEHQLAVELRSYDVWFRPLQVLPNRTHPHMSMASTGGYLLMGFTVDYSLPETDEALSAAIAQSIENATAQVAASMQASSDAQKVAATTDTPADQEVSTSTDLPTDSNATETAPTDVVAPVEENNDTAMQNNYDDDKDTQKKIPIVLPPGLLQRLQERRASSLLHPKQSPYNDAMAYEHIVIPDNNKTPNPLEPHNYKEFNMNRANSGGQKRAWNGKSSKK